ncbi:MAG TPA: Ig-like domain-containing protein, partial [Gemmatimonadaceae bacterium]|nr:Ig-like domain-containing protein [Gemmatimonadaceae bacterium]
MTPARPQQRGLHRLRALFTALLPLAAATCLSDRPAGPGGSVRASIHLQRVARGGAACGPSPSFTLARARVLLRVRGRGDSSVSVANFTGDTATLSLDVPLTGQSALIDILAQTMDSTGDTLFRAADTVTAIAGQRTTVNWLKLWYAAPDSALQTLVLAPRDTQARFTGAFTMRAGGTVAGGGPFGGPVRAAFVSRDTSIALIGANGAVTLKSKAGAAWIVAGTWPGLCDSTTVVAIPPVASVDVKPDTADIVRDGTIQLVVTLKDALGNILTGRPVTWGSTNANASVDTTGLVRGLVANKSARIFATSEGKADSTGIGIGPKPVAKVKITPKPASVQAGSTVTLSAAVTDSQSMANPDWPVTWGTLDATLATVNASGVVTGVKAGVVGITATAGGVADTDQVTVTPNGPTSTVVTPNPDTLSSLNDSLQLTATAYIGATPTTGSFTWATRDAAVVTVTAAGVVIAKGNGSTYVVATEAGGTKDSAHVFVIQKVASINVSPTPVQRYLGTQQTFTANALDARGNAVTGTTFTWSVSDPSVASITGGGVATMLAIGLDTVKATAGTVVGKAVLTVKSAITAIVVTPAGITLDALGKTQAYAAVAKDTLGAVMPGIKFAWTSTNPGVATVPGTTDTVQTATAAANGVTAITATAQGVSGAATLTVAQVLVSIQAGPDPTTVGVGGQAQLIARGKDATGHFIPGGSFTWASDAPTNVTVGAATGIVTGVVLNSSAHVTATSGTVTSNQVLVNVDNSVPPRVSWGRDTIAIGRGSTNNSLPLYLSKPPVSTITVTVAVRDTFAYFSPTTVTFNPGVTTQNATLNGRNAGVTEITATDGSAQYAPDTAVLLVQAAAKFAFNSVSMNQSDYYASQVLLTDPAPAGGLYITYNYGTAGIAQVSPDPAFIPAGQLAANVNVNGLKGGSTTITPAAPGVSGTASTASVSTAVLNFNTGATWVLGAGQYDGNTYVYTPTTMYHPLVVGLGSSDTNVVTSVPSVTIPASTSYAYFTTYAKAIGKVTDTASAAGWTGAIRTVISSTPHVRACCNTSINTTSAAQTVTGYTTDSTFVSHYRINPLFVTLTSSDTSI